MEPKNLELKSVCIDNLIQTYFNYWDTINYKEKYKWEAIRHFQNHFYNTNSDFPTRLGESISMAKNLLASRKYFPGGMLKEISKARPQETEKLIAKLFNNHIPLEERLTNYTKEFNVVVKDMIDHGYSNWKKELNSYQDMHAISVYLAMHRPEKYYIYKYTIFQKFAHIIGYTIQAKKPVERYMEYLEFCNYIRNRIIKNKSLVRFYKGWLKMNNYKDKKYTILTQDVIYAHAVHLNSEAYSKVIKDTNIARSETKDIILESYPFFSISQKKPMGKLNIDYAKNEQRNSELGLQGEFWAMRYERERLAKLGIQFKIEHTSTIKGDREGFDILSVEEDGTTPRYIEVKTT